MAENRTRARVLNVRITDEEVRMVKALAEHAGLSRSDTVRQLIRRAYRREGLGERRAARGRRGKS